MSTPRPSRRHHRSLWLLALSTSSFGPLAGCGGGGGVVSAKAFSQETLNDPDNVKGENLVLARLAKEPAAAGVDAVVAVTGTAEITGLDLQGGKTWTFKHPLDHRPEIAGPVVVGQGGGELFVLDARTGAERFRTKAIGKMVGAGSDGRTVAVTTRTGGGGGGSHLLVYAANGAVKADKESEMSLGIPAVAGGMVFVPWKALYVSTFDADSGAQLATFITETETSRLLPVGGALFAGQGRLVRFDAGILKAKQGQAALVVPPKGLPNVARKELFVSPEHDDKLQADAFDRTVLAARPTPSGPAGFVGDRVYGAYYRVMIGWEPDAKLAWVDLNKDDIVAAAAAKDGVVTVDVGGNVRLLAGANGGVVRTMSLGKAVMSADVSADTMSVGAGESKPLTARIRDVVTLNANELAAAQMYLVQQLDSVPDEAATNVLLEVADSERTATALRDEARKAIALRTNGAEAMLQLLARHASFLRDTRTPPVGPMAKALSTMKETRAAQPLLEQLLDPALPQRDLLDTAEGVSTLAATPQLPLLERFVSLYRGSSNGNIALTDSCAAIGRAILRVDGDKGKEWVSKVSQDPLTDSDLRAALTKVIDATKPKKKKAPAEPAVDAAKAKPKKKKAVDDDPVPPGYKKRKAAEGATTPKDGETAAPPKDGPRDAKDSKDAAPKGSEPSEAAPAKGKPAKGAAAAGDDATKTAKGAKAAATPAASSTP